MGTLSETPPASHRTAGRALAEIVGRGAGVSVDDRTKAWSTIDGRRGLMPGAEPPPMYGSPMMGGVIGNLPGMGGLPTPPPMNGMSWAYRLSDVMYSV